MQLLSLLWTSLLITLTAAQLDCLSVVAKVPTCGLPCITSAARAISCDQLDFSCQCNTASSSAIQSRAQSCVLSACPDISSALAVQSVANNICKCQAQPEYAGALASGSTIPATATVDKATINTSPGNTAMPTSTNAAPAGWEEGRGARLMGVVGALGVAVAAL